jgi:phage/plasmid primase-like uncharacterized protein/antirestriction protein ArdC
VEAGSFIRNVADLFVERIATGQAVWQQDVRSSLSSMPLTVSEDQNVPLSGGNALLLAQAMWDNGWHDPRFLTAEHVVQAGGVIGPDAESFDIQFVRAVGADGSLLERPEAITYSMFNAEQVSGLPAWTAPSKDWTLEMLAARLLPKFETNIVHDQADGAYYSVEDGNVHMPPMSAFSSVGEYVGVAVHELSHASRHELGRTVVGQVGTPSFAREELRAEMASMQLSVALGLPHDVDRHAGFSREWESLLRADPGEFFRAARDAEKMAALVLWHVRSVEKELEVEKELDVGEMSSVENGSKRGAGTKGAYLARLEKLFESRQAVLVVPYAEKDKAHAAGAVYYPSQKLWFAPQDADMSALKPWLMREGISAVSQMPSRSTLLNDFQRAMESMGLVLNAKDVEKLHQAKDGEWDYVKVQGHKSNKSGAYVLNLDGGRDGRPTGVIMNHKTGKRFTWKHDGPELTPEQLARMRAEAAAREALAAKELSVRQGAAALQATALWNRAMEMPQMDDSFKHGYFRLKGIAAHGARVADGSTLLEYPAFAGEDGRTVIKESEIYALIPLHDAAGKIWNLQAISEDGKTKSFMAGAKKKGLYCLLGEERLGAAKWPEYGAIAFAEGFATGASIREASDWPVVVCFDAGNLESVAKEMRSTLPEGVVKIIAADNDQFFMERAMGALAKVGLVAAVNGPTVQVSVGADSVREVCLGTALADGEWHQESGGRYRMVFEEGGYAAPGCVGLVSVETVFTSGGVDSDRKMLKLGNRGMEAAAVAAFALPGAIVASPVFASLDGRPTDWNDLASREGKDAVRTQLSKQVSKELLPERVFSGKSIAEVPTLARAGRGGR